jgi:hypothetical protein
MQIDPRVLSRSYHPKRDRPLGIGEMAATI